MAKQYHMIRVPDQVYRQLVRVAAEILTSKELGRGFNKVPLCEQGEIHVPLYAVIELALDAFEDHRKRSNPKSSRKTQ
jgi:hypothetical protein